MSSTAPTGSNKGTDGAPDVATGQAAPLGLDGPIGRDRPKELVAVLHDETPAGDTALLRSASLGNPVLAVTEDAASVDDLVSTWRVDVVEEIGLTAGFAAAAKAGAGWIVVPESLAAPVRLMRHVTAWAARPDAGGGIVHVVRSWPADPPPFTAILAVAGSYGQASGLTALAAAGLAMRAGAHIEVLLLGVTPGTPMTTRAQRLAALGATAGATQFDRASDLVDEADVELVYRPAAAVEGDTADAVHRVEQHTRQREYDVVVLTAPAPDDDPRTRTERAGLCMWALESFPGDVVIVIDGLIGDGLPSATA
jgi:hypothetical protein